MPNVEPIIERLGRARAALEAAAKAVPADKWGTRPREGAWSAAEVIAHLTMVEEQITGKAGQLIALPPVRVPLRGRLHVPVILTRWRLKRVKSPISLDASRVTVREEMLSRLGAAREHTLTFIEQTRGRDLSDYRFKHPLLGSLNLYGWLELLAHHEARHTKQIREIVIFFQR